VSIGADIKRLREMHSLTQVEIAKIAGVSDKAVSTWENGIKEPRMGAIQKIADYFGLQKSNIIEDNGLSEHGSKHCPLPSNFTSVNHLYRIPIIGSVRCGYGGAAFEEIVGHDFADVKNPDEYIFFAVKGDSMEPEIREGNLALVHRQPNVESGELAIVVINGEEGTLKKVIKKEGTLILQAFNSKYEPLTFSGKELDLINICGKVVETKKKW
jgi:repressor LexA